MKITEVMIIGAEFIWRQTAENRCAAEVFSMSEQIRNTLNRVK